MQHFPFIRVAAAGATSDDSAMAAIAIDNKTMSGSMAASQFA